MTAAAAPDRVTTGSRVPPWRVVLLAVAGSVAVNLLLFGLGRLLGGSYAFTRAGGLGRTVVTAGTVAGFTTVPLLVGLVAAVLLSRRWPRVLTLALAVAPTLALVTIVVMTLPADLDAVSTTMLALCHVTLAVVSVLALLTLRRSASQRRPDRL